MFYEQIKKYLIKFFESLIWWKIPQIKNNFVFIINNQTFMLLQFKSILDFLFHAMENSMERARERNEEKLEKQLNAR
jgi:hypothetical protein